MPQRCGCRRFQDGVAQHVGNIGQQRKAGTGFDVVLDDACVLTAGAVQFVGKCLIFKHRVIYNLGQVGVFLRSKFAQLLHDVIGKTLTHVRGKFGHNVCHGLYFFLSVHLITSQLIV